MRETLGSPDAPDRFVLLRKIGGGGMGVVYEALDRTTGVKVALKTLHESKPRFLLELKREFRAVQGILHPNLVRLYGLFQCHDIWFFTMELVHGQDYWSWLCGSTAEPGAAAGETGAIDAADTVSLRPEDSGNGAPFRAAPLADIERLRRTLPQLASALIALHGAGLVHRDVKPSNILVTDEGRLVLLDFGLVRTVAMNEHIDWTLAGTPAYMAPEQATGQPVTAAADCYAAGVILYQALTGRLPFVGRPYDLIQQKEAWPPAAPHLLAPQAPADLEALCLELLLADPEARPTATEIATRLGRPRRARDAIRPGSQPVPLFVGREDELARIRTAFDGVADGRPAIVVIEGESGIGKTSLLSEALRRLSREHARAMVLRGRCFEREVVAYAGVDMIIDSLAAHLRRLGVEQAAFFTPRYLSALRQLFPALSTVPAFSETNPSSHVNTDHEARMRALAAFRELFARVALRHEIVMVIDDAQWLTEESLLVLRSLLDPDDPVPLVLLLAACGPDLGRLSPWLETLPGRVTRVALGPLSRTESVAFLRLHLGQRDETQLTTMAEDSAGHPLFLSELAQVADDGESTTYTRVDDVLRERAGHLEPRCRTILDLICVVARPISQHVVGAAAGVEPSEIAAAVSELIQRRCIVGAPGGGLAVVQPAHDRIRAALRNQMSPARQRELQRRLAEAMESHDANDAEALAVQWNEAGDMKRAAVFARRAAERAMAMLAFERAVDLYAVALRGEAEGAERASLLAAKGDALAALARGPEAAAAYLEASRHCAGREGDDFVLRSADQLIRSGRIDAGKRLLGRVLDGFGITLPESHAAAARRVFVRRLALWLRGSRPRVIPEERRPELLRRLDACWSAGDLLALVDPLRSAALHAQGLQIALDVAEPYRLARLLGLDAAFVSVPGRSKRRAAMARLEQAEVLAGQVRAPQLDGYIALSRGVVHMGLGELAEAQRAFDSAEAIFEQCPGAYWETHNACKFALWTLAYRGQLAELAQRFGAAVSSATARDDKLAAFMLLSGPSHVVLLASDEPLRLLAASDVEALGLAREHCPFLHFCALFARTQALLYLGRAGEAVDTVEGERELIRAVYLLRSQFYRVDFAGLRARAALAALATCPTSDRPRLVAIAQACARRLRREGVGWATALAASIEASLSTLRHSTGEAATRLLAAAARLTSAGLGGHAAAVRWQVRHVLDQPGQVGDEPGDAWHEPVVIRPDRLAQTLAPLPLLPSPRA